jgi:hypothetical protein
MDNSQPLPPDPNQPAAGVQPVVQTPAPQLPQLPASVLQAADPGGDPVEVKPSWFWIKDTNGNASVSTTLVTVAFVVTSMAYVFSIIERLGPVTFRPFDAAAAGAYFIPILTLYFGRHWVDSNAKNPVSGG